MARRKGGGRLDTPIPVEDMRHELRVALRHERVSRQILSEFEQLSDDDIIRVWHNWHRDQKQVAKTQRPRVDDAPRQTKEQVHDDVDEEEVEDEFFEASVDASTDGIAQQAVAVIEEHDDGAGAMHGAARAHVETAARNILLANPDPSRGLSLCATEAGASDSDEEIEILGELLGWLTARKGKKDQRDLTHRVRKNTHLRSALRSLRAEMCAHNAKYSVSNYRAQRPIGDRFSATIGFGGDRAAKWAAVEGVVLAEGLARDWNHTAEIKAMRNVERAFRVENCTEFKPGSVELDVGKSWQQLDSQTQNDLRALHKILLGLRDPKPSSWTPSPRTLRALLRARGVWCGSLTAAAANQERYKSIYATVERNIVSFASRGEIMNPMSARFFAKVIANTWFRVEGMVAWIIDSGIVRTITETASAVDALLSGDGADGGAGGITEDIARSMEKKADSEWRGLWGGTKHITKKVLQSVYKAGRYVVGTLSKGAAAMLKYLMSTLLVVLAAAVRQFVNSPRLTLVMLAALNKFKRKLCGRVSGTIVDMFQTAARNAGEDTWAKWGAEKILAAFDIMLMTPYEYAKAQKNADLVEAAPLVRQASMSAFKAGLNLLPDAAKTLLDQFTVVTGGIAAGVSGVVTAAMGAGSALPFAGTFVGDMVRWVTNGVYIVMSAVATFTAETSTELVSEMAMAMALTDSVTELLRVFDLRPCMQVYRIEALGQEARAKRDQEENEIYARLLKDAEKKAKGNGEPLSAATLEALEEQAKTEANRNAVNKLREQRETTKNRRQWSLAMSAADFGGSTLGRSVDDSDEDKLTQALEERMLRQSSSDTNDIFFASGDDSAAMLARATAA